MIGRGRGRGCTNRVVSNPTPPVEPEENHNELPNIEVLVIVQSQVGITVDVSRVYRNCSLRIQGEVFLANLVELAFSEFDLIFSMDWLSVH